MRDQAEELRNLVLRSTREKPLQLGPEPKLVVLSAGQAGVGVTCLSLNIAISLAEQGTRVALLDADAQNASVAKNCGIAPGANLGDIFTGRRTVHEVIARGPAGLQVIPGLVRTDSAGAPPFDQQAHRRLASEIHSLGKHVDTVVVDAGSHPDQLTSQLWQASDLALFVTTPDASAIMDTYASMKTHREELFESKTDVQLLVNQVRDESSAIDVHSRINQSCQRFLSQSITLLGCIPFDNAVTSATMTVSPFIIRMPNCRASQAVNAVARALMQSTIAVSRAAA